MDHDPEVDGGDLAIFVTSYVFSFTSADLADFAKEFGKTSCF
jgi:hypothetical protein